MVIGSTVWITNKKTGKDHPLRVQFVFADGSIKAINETSSYSRLLKLDQWRSPQEQTNKLMKDGA